MAPPGLLPMSVTAILQNNLVGSVKPGDRVQMIGIYKIIATMNTKMGGIFKPYFVCMSVKPLSYVSPINRKLTTTTFPDS
jgi:DNA replication licensing factor MCM3